MQQVKVVSCGSETEQDNKHTFQSLRGAFGASPSWTNRVLPLDMPTAVNGGNCTWTIWSQMSSPSIRLFFFSGNWEPESVSSAITKRRQMTCLERAHRRTNKISRHQTTVIPSWSWNSDISPLFYRIVRDQCLWSTLNTICVNMELQGFKKNRFRHKIRSILMVLVWF